MARQARMHLPGIPEHVIQRGNNRQLCFLQEDDYVAYVHWLKEYTVKFGVQMHAWVLMSNHVHLLCTPTDQQGISLMMQSLGRQYVRYFNYRYQRTGTLWEGRFKATLVLETEYLITLYRYIENNPVRAGMVASPADYKWSSYAINALGKHSDLCHPHPCYLALGNHPAERANNYRLGWGFD